MNILMKKLTRIAFIKILIEPIIEMMLVIQIMMPKLTRHIWKLIELEVSPSKNQACGAIIE